jgi:hypothetical protein
MLLIPHPHIVLLQQLPQIANQRHQLPILIVVVEGDYWDAVFGLDAVRYARVVDQDHVLQVAVDVAQVLYVQAFLEGAVLPVKTVRNEFGLWVDVVDDGVRV